MKAFLAISLPEAGVEDVKVLSWKIKAFPASQYRWGLRVPRIVHGKPELPGAAISDKSFIPHHASSYGLGNAKPRFFPKTAVLPQL